MKPSLLLIFLVLILTSNIFAQEYKDLLITLNDVYITCEIKQIKYGKVKYRTKDKSYAEIKDITNFSDLKFSDSTKIKNILNLKIGIPEVGYSYLYFYPANGRIYEVVNNDKKLIKIKPNSYYLLKVESGKRYEYYCQGNDHKEDRLKIDAKDREVYLIKGVPGKNTIKGGFNGSFGYGLSTKLVVDNGKLSRYTLLTMKKKAK